MARAMRDLRGAEISMIFQEPMTSLNPLHTIERQVNEVLILHKGLSREAARKRTLELLGSTICGYARPGGGERLAASVVGLYSAIVLWNTVDLGALAVKGRAERLST